MEIKTYSDYGDFIRGQVLSDFIMIENMINLILAKNMCNDDAKIQENLNIIAEVNLPTRISKLKEFLKEKKYSFDNNELIEGINKYKDLRNSFSHSIIEIYDTLTIENMKELKLVKLDKLQKSGKEYRLDRVFKVSELPKNKFEMIKIQIALTEIVVK